MTELILNEIRGNLAKFAIEWAGAIYERGQAQGFWREFYACFGISGQSAVLYEHQVKKLGGAQGFIDSFIPGKLIVEAKSKGKSLDAAFDQAEAYALALSEAERPRWVVVSDFETFRITDLSKDSTTEVRIDELSAKADHFRFLIGDVDEIIEEREINRDAAYKVSKLHTELLRGGFEGVALDVFLTRLLFCYFADDTGLFGENGAFHRLLKRVSDAQLGGTLSSLFQTLDMKPENRQKALDEEIARFPHINGTLFKQRLDMPVFSTVSAKLLRECSLLDWSDVSPAIFGAMFQGILEGEYQGKADASRQETRRETGAHYTSERNILKVLKPLFLDKLRDELETGRTNREQLRELYDRLPNLTFLDPACGCGSFLVIAYRELRRLEMDIVDVLLKGRDRTKVDTSNMLRVTVHQFHGIELGESPAEIAKVALWITDHQMSMEAARRFGSARRSLPLLVSPTIKIGNALRMAWETVIPATHCDFVIGNPPFVGKKEQTVEQKADLAGIFGKGPKAMIPAAGNLDYVTGWFVKAAQYVQGSIQSKIELDLWAKDESAWGSKDNEKYLDIDAGWRNWQPTRIGFVATNSIMQGEQVGVLWRWMLAQGIHIQFAHRTFAWSNEGKGNAAVHCVIVGFGTEQLPRKLYDYSNVKGDPLLVPGVENISPYLTPGRDVTLVNRRSHLQDRAATARYGSMPIDDGHLILSIEDVANISAERSENDAFVRPYIGGDELLHNKSRWCLWITDDLLPQARNSVFVCARIKETEAYRKRSGRAATNALAVHPYAFGEIRQPVSTYLAIPKVSSQTREFLPLAFVEPAMIASGSLLTIDAATTWQFGLLSSTMHNAWMRTVAGRMKSDYQYSVQLVYNNFPWPAEDVDTEAIEHAAQAVLNARGTNSLSSSYEAAFMTAALRNAHKDLDAAVDKAYGYPGDGSDLDRMAFLFWLYEKVTDET